MQISIVLGILTHELIYQLVKLSACCLVIHFVLISTCLHTGTLYSNTKSSFLGRSSLLVVSFHPVLDLVQRLLLPVESPHSNQVEYVGE